MRTLLMGVVMLFVAPFALADVVGGYGSITTNGDGNKVVDVYVLGNDTGDQIDSLSGVTLATDGNFGQSPDTGDLWSLPDGGDTDSFFMPEVTGSVFELDGAISIWANQGAAPIDFVDASSLGVPGTAAAFIGQFVLEDGDDSFNLDATVNITDQFGVSSSSLASFAIVPAPGVLALLGAAGLVGLGRRPRRN